MSETLSQAQAHSESRAPIWERKGMTQEDYLVSKAEQARRIGGKLVERAMSLTLEEVRYEDRDKIPSVILPTESKTHPTEYSGISAFKPTKERGVSVGTEIDLSDRGGIIRKGSGRSIVEVSLGKGYPINKIEKETFPESENKRVRSLVGTEIYIPEGYSRHFPTHPDSEFTPLGVEDTVSVTANILNSTRNDIRATSEVVNRLNAPQRARDIAKM